MPDLLPPKSAPQAPNVPPSLALTERAGALLRRHLRGLDGDGDGGDGWEVVYANDLWFFDFDLYLDDLEAGAAWEPLPGITAARAVGVGHSFEKAAPTTLLRPGVCVLDAYGTAVARWMWHDTEGGGWDSIHLVAVRDADGYKRLKTDLKRLRAGKNRSKWQVVRGMGHDGRSFPRHDAAKLADELVVDAELLGRLRREAVGLFRDETRALYRKLGVAPRRGILLHGPPGNGKTSLIRLIAAELPDVAALLLRPGEGFDTDDLEVALRRWREQAPALLVIEDLDWLLERVDVSRFLNLLDGLETPEDDKPLLLIATTNHPEKLDPAVNNRPGRFDAGIEVGDPDEDLRRRLLDRLLPELGDDERAEVAGETGGLSFAHLHELTRLAGLLALEAKRESRTAEDVAAALKLVRQTTEAAAGGWGKSFEQPFGLKRRR